MPPGGGPYQRLAFSDEDGASMRMLTRTERETAWARFQVFYTCDTLFVGGLRFAHTHVLAFKA